MRLNWFSPLPPERTDIAHYTARCAEALQGEFDVVYWTTTRASDNRALLQDAHIEIYSEADIASAEFRRKLFEGVNIFNIGNDARYHSSIYSVARRYPGIIILHDTKLHHFIRGAHPMPEDFVDVSRRYYGESGVTHAKAIIAGQETIDENVERMPFTEAVLDKAIGVICHSSAVRAEIASRVRVPVVDLALPYKRTVNALCAEKRTKQPFELIAFGYMGTNRRLESILRALADFDKRHLCKLRIFGTLWDEGFIRGLIDTLRLNAIVELRGYVEEEELDRAIADAHLAFNLRFPTMGEASGGILRSWHNATAPVVTAQGWYEALPDDVAFKISVENECAEIQQLLDRLIIDPKKFESCGRAGRNYLRQVHDPDLYALGLKGALEDVQALNVRYAARLMMQRSSKVLSGDDIRPFLLDHLSEKVAELFGS